MHFPSTSADALNKSSKSNARLQCSKKNSMLFCSWLFEAVFFKDDSFFFEVVPPSQMLMVENLVDELEEQGEGHFLMKDCY